MEHAFKQKVFYSDTDAYGVVWHGSYLRWLEMGRVYLCEKAGLFLKELENVQFLGFCSEMNNVENLKSLENIDLIIFEIGQENSDEILKEVK